MNSAYDAIGDSDASVRQADPRLARQIIDAMGDCASVLNVGVGAGSYEPPDAITAGVDPSRVMTLQRPPGAAPPLRAFAEALPIADGVVDASLAVLTTQHWSDVDVGLQELVRVSRKRIVIVTMDIRVLARHGWSRSTSRSSSTFTPHGSPASPRY
jgi:SAM-dependent methyltransferase